MRRETEQSGDIFAQVRSAIPSNSGPRQNSPACLKRAKQGLRCPVAALEARPASCAFRKPSQTSASKVAPIPEKSKNRYVREADIICVMVVTYTGGSFSRYSLAHEHRVVPTTQRRRSYHEQEPYRQNPRTDGRGT